MNETVECVFMSRIQPGVFQWDGGDPLASMALQEKARRMTEAQIVVLNGKPGSRSEVLAVGIEAFNRGLLPEGEQVKLAAMLREEEQARLEAQEEARFRSRHAGLSREEVAMMTEGRR
jgi:hypothetical protein